MPLESVGEKQVHIETPKGVNLGFPEVLLEGGSCLRIEERKSGGRWGERGDCYCSVAKSCPTLCDPPPSSSVLGVSQARILDWVTIS